jgi:uncharacterized protein
MSFVHRRILNTVLAVVRHPWLTLAVVAVTLSAGVLLAVTRLTISTDENKLFSDKPWFFHDYLEFIKRFPENEAIYIVVEPRDPAFKPTLTEWAAVADHVTDAVAALKDQVRSAYCRIPLDQLGKQAILFDDPSDLHERFEQVKRFVPLAALWGQAPGVAEGFLGRTPIERFLTGVVAQPSDETAAFVAPLVESLHRAVVNPGALEVLDLKQLGPADPTQLGYFYTPNQLDVDNRQLNKSKWRYRILVRVYPARLFNSLTSVTRTVNAIRNAAYKAGADYPKFQIGVTGRPALEGDQLETTDVDSRRAEIVALICVFGGMALMMRSLWLALAAEIALGVGIGWAFGWATISVGQLNLLSLVFLIALIGIGMDYLVQILTRYRVEARRYERAEAVWVRVFRHVGPPINTACLGAAGAFFVAVFTEFRGAAELGIIAGGGLLLCLLAGYVVLPAILTLFPAKLTPYDAAERYKPPRKIGGIQRIVMPVTWCALLLIGSRFMPRTEFDPGLLSLQVQSLESVRLINTLQTWTSVVMSKDLKQIADARAAVRGLPPVGSTDSILTAMDNADWLKAHASELPDIQWVTPAAVTVEDLPRISAKARNLAHVFMTGASAASAARSQAAATLIEFADSLDRLSPEAAASAAHGLSQWQVGFVQELTSMLEQFRPGDLDIAAVPEQLRSHYVSPDGYYAFYIYPRKDLWDPADNNGNLREFETVIEQAVARVPGSPRVTGIGSDVYHTTQATHDAFFHSTIYALLLIFLLVLLDFRKLGPTLAAISVLAMGLPMLVAIMGFLHVNWNFANFFGLPILIGAGHEYGVFMVHRYLEACKYERRAWGRWDVSDRALLLCAFITTSSFGWFWALARHKGLRSLGLVMSLGTLCIYLATIMVLRPLLKWRLVKTAKKPRVLSAQEA